MGKFVASLFFVSFLPVIAIAACINVTSPAEGEEFKIGDEIVITWTNDCNVLGNARITLLRVGTRPQEIILSQSYPIGALKFPYRIQAPFRGGRFLVEIKKNVEIKGRSRIFTIRGETSLLTAKASLPVRKGSDFRVKSVGAYQGVDLMNDVYYTNSGAKKVPLKVTVQWNKISPDASTICSPLVDFFMGTQRIATNRMTTQTNGIGVVKALIDIPPGFPVDSTQKIMAKLRFRHPICDTKEQNNSLSATIKLLPQCDLQIRVRRMFQKKVLRLKEGPALNYQIHCVVSIKNLGRFKTGNKIRFAGTLNRLYWKGYEGFVCKENRVLNKSVAPGQEYIREITFSKTIRQMDVNEHTGNDIRIYVYVDPPHPKTGKRDYLETNYDNNWHRRRFKIIQ